MYYYVTNQQGDVVAIYNASGTKVGSYGYDAYGKVISISGEIAQLNPIRYRGYYFDTESGLYYLNSRYYDADTGRFINADDTAVLEIDQNSLIESNLFSYCLNNPVNKHDSSGYFALALAGGGYLAGSWAIGGANFWNPVGWVILGVAAVATVSVGIYYAAEHTKNKRKSTSDKHTKPRPGRQSEKKKRKPGWKTR